MIRLKCLLHPVSGLSHFSLQFELGGPPKVRVQLSPPRCLFSTQFGFLGNLYSSRDCSIFGLGPLPVFATGRLSTAIFSFQAIEH